MNRPNNRPRSPQGRCSRPSMPYCSPVQLMEFNRELQELLLAMAYVPMQRWQNLYDTDLAMERGTIFAELDKPFLGKDAVITNER